MQPTKPSHPTIRIGIDIGGTFTDFVIFSPASGKISTFKLPSTPHDPSEAVQQGIKKISNQITDLHNSSGTNFSIIHGSTVATNALLERKGAATALITTRGFKDVIQIGRQNCPDLYDFATTPPEPLIPSELRFELEERIDQNGEVLTELDANQVDKLQMRSPSNQRILNQLRLFFCSHSPTPATNKSLPKNSAPLITSFQLHTKSSPNIVSTNAQARQLSTHMFHQYLIVT